MRGWLLGLLIGVFFLSGCAQRGYTTADVGAMMVSYEGEVISTRTVYLKDSGEGSILGAIIGAVIGHQIGGGSGRDVATAAGAVLGGVVGSKLNQSEGQELIIALDNGKEISTVVRIDPERPFYFKPGDRVRIFVRRGRIVKIEPIFLRD